MLKLLQKSYAGRVKMIYIDPPYNTGGDLIYSDDFSEPLESYLSRTKQADEEGLLTSNPKMSGRFHSKWLSMMYPRLILARSLLRDDGVIFISIDDNELHNLRQIMDEIFGPENFLGVFVWQSKKGGGSDNSGLVNDQEYVVCYAKNKSADPLSRIYTEAEALNLADERGPYRLGRELNKWGAGSRREDRPTMFFPIPGPDGEDVYPIRNDGTEGRWRKGRKKMMKLVNRGDVDFFLRESGSYIVYEKIRSTDPRTKPFRTWLSDVGTTADGTKAIKQLFDGRKAYDFPKPLELIKQLIAIGTSAEDDIVLDFFAGSGTTAQALLELNYEDEEAEAYRNFICIQMPERTPEKSEACILGHQTLSQVTKERIKRVVKRIQLEMSSRLELTEAKDTLDLGFKVLRLSRSSFRPWRRYEGGELVQLKALFDEIESPLAEGWTPEKLLTEILLMEGFPLHSRVTPHACFADNHVQLVESDFHEHRLWLCLDRTIEEATSELLKQKMARDDVFVCLDSALTDQSKMRLDDALTIHTI